MTKITTACILVALLVSGIPTFAKNGTSPYQFLNIAPTVKGDQMGNATVSIVFPIVSSACYNPAVLRYSKSPQIGFNYQDLGDGINLINLAASFSTLKGQGAIAAYNHLGYGKFESTTETLTGDYDPNGSSTKKIDGGSSEFLLGYGMKLTKRISGGMTLKILSEQVMKSEKISDTYLDFSFLYASKLLNFGLNLENALKLSKNKIPFKLSSGISKNFTVVSKNDLFIATDLRYSENGAGFSAGVSYAIEMFFIRLGYNSEDKLTPFRYGAGLRFGEFQFDFSVKKNALSQTILAVGMNMTL